MCCDRGASSAADSAVSTAGASTTSDVSSDASRRNAGALVTEPTLLVRKATEGIAVAVVLCFGLAEPGRNECNFVAGAESRRDDWGCCDVVGPREVRTATFALRGVDPRASTCTLVTERRSSLMDKIGRGGFVGFVFAEIGSWHRA